MAFLQLPRHFWKYLGNCRKFFAAKILYLCGVLGVRGVPPVQECGKLGPDIDGIKTRLG